MVRLDSKTMVLIEQLAEQLGRTKSEVIREAVTALVTERRGRTQQSTPYEAMEPLLGCVKGGPKRLSERTGERFSRFLQSRKR